MSAAAQSRSTHVIGIVAGYTDTKWSTNAPSALDAILFRRSDSLRAYFAEGSGGAHLVSGSVHSQVLTIPQLRPSGRCGQPGQAQLAAVIRDAGIDLAKYTTLVLVVSSSAGGCPGGIAYSLTYAKADGSVARIRVAQAYSLTARFILHEVGHTEGLGHAKAIRCGAAPLGPVCRHAEYGNIWDTQGNGAIQTYQAAFRARLGWVRPIRHAAGLATYTIGPAYAPGSLPNAIELVLPPPAPAASIEVVSPISLWIEYRAPFGFDSRMADGRLAGLREGAFINATGSWHAKGGGRAPRNDCDGGQACLLDMTPGDGNFRNAALAVGKTWTDEATGTSISVDARTDTTLTVTLSIPSASAKAP